MTTNNPENAIYITYKSRMKAEAKLRQTGRWLNNLITWYSFCLIIISLSELMQVYQFYRADFIFTVCSIGLFGISLFVSGERYFEKADQFRSCYLELQELFRSSLATKNKMKRYAEILKKYENQRDDDYDDIHTYVPRSVGPSPHSLVRQVVDTIRSDGKDWSFVRIDVKNFFPNILHHRLDNELKYHGINDQTRRNYITC